MNTSRRRWPALILLIGILGGTAVAAAATSLWPTQYRATARIMITSPDWNDSTLIPLPGATPSSYGDEFTQQRMPTYMDLVTTPIVLAPAADQVRGATSAGLRDAISARLVPDTVMLDITARDSDPHRAADIANAVAHSFAAAVTTLEQPKADVASPVQAVLAAPAAPPSKPATPALPVFLIWGAAIGFGIALTVAAIVGRPRGLRIDSRDDGTETVGGVPLLGVVEDDTAPATTSVVVVAPSDTSTNAFDDALRALAERSLTPIGCVITQPSTRPTERI